MHVKVKGCGAVCQGEWPHAVITYWNEKELLCAETEKDRSHAEHNGLSKVLLNEKLPFKLKRFLQPN